MLLRQRFRGSMLNYILANGFFGPEGSYVVTFCAFRIRGVIYDAAGRYLMVPNLSTCAT